MGVGVVSITVTAGVVVETTTTVGLDDIVFSTVIGTTTGVVTVTGVAFVTGTVERLVVTMVFVKVIDLVVAELPTDMTVLVTAFQVVSHGPTSAW